MDSVENSSLALPVAILPGKTENVDCFIYKDTAPDDVAFNVDIKDAAQNTVASDIFTISVRDNVPTTEFSWQYNGRHRPNIPNSEYLYDYYVNLNRTLNEDYSLYIFDPYDNQYIDAVLETLMFGFTGTTDVLKVNYIASFVQNLDYTEDTTENDYPRYPIETIFYGNGGGDCEDKAILTASLLYNLGYDVALFRLPNHMAVGVHLSESAISNYDYYEDEYYFLETTTPGKPCGFIPNEYRDALSELTVYPITSRPLLVHNWQNGTLTIYTNSELGDIVKVTLEISNLGIETARNVRAEGGFYTSSELKLNYIDDTIYEIEPGMKKEVIITANIPKDFTTQFKTRLYLNGKVVDEKESASFFP